MSQKKLSEVLGKNLAKLDPGTIATLLDWDKITIEQLRELEAKDFLLEPLDDTLKWMENREK